MNPEYSPKVNLSSESISFPPCRLGEAVYQTLVLHNYGDTLVQFNFVAAAKASSREADAGTGAAGGCRWFGAFGVLPSQGVLEPRSQRLVSVRALTESSTCGHYQMYLLLPTRPAVMRLQM